MVQNSDNETIKLIIETSEYCLKDKKVLPLVKLNSLRLLKEAVDTKDFKLV